MDPAPLKWKINCFVWAFTVQAEWEREGKVCFPGGPSSTGKGKIDMPSISSAR